MWNFTSHIRERDGFRATDENMCIGEGGSDRGLKIRQLVATFWLRTPDSMPGQFTWN